jgi:hypothetical protein
LPPLAPEQCLRLTKIKLCANITTVVFNESGFV